MKLKKSIWLAGIIALMLVVAIGTASIAVGQTGASKDGDQGEQSPKYEASITVDEETVEGLSETEEKKALAPLAKISETEAIAAAEAEVNRKASETELGSENGALVYEVKIGEQEVKIDAGNSKVLHIEKDDEDSVTED